VTAEVVVALIAAVASVIAAIIAFRAQIRVTRLSASLGEERAESDARRAYEYEARKRLYTAYEPLRVRLLASTDNAINRIEDIICRSSRGPTTESSPEYRLEATIYYLLAPLVVARIVERRLTLVDLGLNERVHTEFVLAQAICRSLADEARAAQLSPELPYSPYVEGWRDKREADPRRFQRQGLPLGRLNTTLDALQVTRPEGTETLMSFGEFEPNLDGVDAADVRSGLGAARDLLMDFDPATRPVLWRILVIQALLYWCFQETVFGESMPARVDLEERFVASDIGERLRAALETRSDVARVEDFATSTSVAIAYFVASIAPALQRVQRLAQASQTQDRAK
jgi:hypothetical protein